MKNIFGTIFIFVSIFILSIFYINNKSSLKTSDELACIKEFENTIEQTFFNIESKFKPDKFFEEELLKLEVSFSKSKNLDYASIKKKIQTIKKTFPGIFNFTFVDGNGETVSELCDSVPPKSLLQKFFYNYKSFLADKSPISESLQSFIQSFLGKFVPANRKIHSKLIYAQEKFEKRFVFLSAPSSNGFFIVHVTQSANWELFPLREILRKYRILQPYFNLGIYNFRLKKLYPGKYKFASSESTETIIQRALQTSQNILFHQGRLYFTKFLNPAICLIGEITIPEFFWKSRQNRLFLSYSLMFVLSLCISLVFYFRSSLLFEVNIRNKLIIVFLGAAGIPVIAIFGNLFSLISEKKEIYEKQLFADVISYLNQFDNKFKHSLGTLEAKIAKDLNNLEKGTNKLPENDLKRFAKTYVVNNFQVFDRKGKLVFQEKVGHQISWGDSFWQGFEKSAIRIMDEIEKNNIIPGKRIKFKDLIKDKQNISDNNIFLSLVGSTLGQTSFFEIDQVKILLMTSILWDSKNKPAFFLVFFWEKSQLEELYIQKNILQTWKAIPETKVWAVGKDSTKVVIPHKKNRSPELIEFISDLKSSGKTQTRIVRNTLFSGFPCKDLENFYLVGITSDRGIKKKLSSLFNNVFTTVILTLVFTVAIAVFLSLDLIKPVSRLRSGIENLKNRNFSFRLETSESDEWHDLLGTFNKIMDGMEELEVTKALSDCFFPNPDLHLQSWSIHGISIPTSQVGGDFFDYKIINPDKVFLLLGNASGQGISAGLVVAMTKALLSHPLTPLDPKKTLNILNSVFLKVLRKKKTMRCLIALFDVKKEEIIFANAGQTFPLIIRNKETFEIEMPGFPLGLKQESDFKEKAYSVFKNDLLVLYTEGIVSCRDENDSYIGYKRFYTHLSELYDKDSVKTIEKILLWINKIVKNKSQQNDISLILCQRVLK
ncbi:MAG: SpoIIE family protein phosphatase [Candidatus Riflebacteria bacterium]|nr:SpoIIE family protein phosphatase [Candidatus Riflebacteria bacterium]